MKHFRVENAWIAYQMFCSVIPYVAISYICFSFHNAIQETSKKRLARVAESVGLDLEEDGSEDERVNAHKQKKLSSAHLKKLQQVLFLILSSYFLLGFEVVCKNNIT